MKSKNLLKDTVVLKIHSGDGADYSAQYDEYTLTNVRVVEKRGSSPDMTSSGAVYVYFFRYGSQCVDKSGCDVALPAPEYGDMCVIHPGESGEEEMRVALVEYRNGPSGNGTAEREDAISHVKISLK